MPKIELAQINLPIVEILPEVVQKMKEEQNLILNAEAGAGKSTIIPLALLEILTEKKQKIIMLMRLRFLYFLGCKNLNRLKLLRY